MKKKIKALLAAAGYFLTYEACQYAVALVFSVIAFWIYSYNSAVNPFFSYYSGDAESFVQQLAVQNQNLLMALSYALPAVLFLAVLALRKKSIPHRFAVVPSPNGLALLTALPLGILLNPVVSFLLSLLPERWLAGYEESSAALDAAPTLFYFVILCLLGPLAEEVLFRGLVQGALRRAFPAAVAVLLQAVAFGAAHGEAVWIAYATLLGILFGVLREKYQSVWISFAVHAGFNFSTFLSLLLPESWLSAHPAVYVPLLMVSTLGSVLFFVSLLHQPGAEPCPEPCRMPPPAPAPAPVAPPEPERPENGLFF